MKKIYTEYEELKKQEKIIADEIEKIKPLIIEDMKTNGKEKIPVESGSFSLNELSRWNYSPEVEKANVKLSKLKEKEQRTGVATQSTVLSLAFYPKKENK